MEFITLNNGVKMPAEGIGTFLLTPDNAFFDAQGLHVYHAAANVVFDDADILNWIVSKHK